MGRGAALTQLQHVCRPEQCTTAALLCNAHPPCAAKQPLPHHHKEHSRARLLSLFASLPCSGMWLLPRSLTPSSSAWQLSRMRRQRGGWSWRAPLRKSTLHGALSVGRVPHSGGGGDGLWLQKCWASSVHCASKQLAYLASSSVHQCSSLQQRSAFTSSTKVCLHLIGLITPTHPPAARIPIMSPSDTQSLTPHSPCTRIHARRLPLRELLQVVAHSRPQYFYTSSRRICFHQHQGARGGRSMQLHPCFAKSLRMAHATGLAELVHTLAGPAPWALLPPLPPGQNLEGGGGAASSHQSAGQQECMPHSPSAAVAQQLHSSGTAASQQPDEAPDHSHTSCSPGRQQRLQSTPVKAAAGPGAQRRLSGSKRPVQLGPAATLYYVHWADEQGGAPQP